MEFYYESDFKNHKQSWTEFLSQFDIDNTKSVDTIVLIEGKGYFVVYD